MKNIFYITALIFLSISLNAQNQVDILRFSQYQIGGTARSISYGGAVGSLGADFSSLSVNPAGIGMYRKSAVSISPTFYFSNVNAEMGDFNTTAYKDNFNLNQYGLVFSNNLNRETGWKFFQFAIGVNRLNNFNHYTHIKNENRKNSLMTDYIQQAKNTSPENLDPFSTDLAWYNWLIDTIPGGTNYTSQLENGGITQEMKKRNWGSVNEMSLTIGSSYSDVFYIGGSIGFPFASFYEESEYSEYDLADTINNFNKYTLDNKLETHGNGVNFKLGMIIRPTGFLRLGIAFHSPTWYNMTDSWGSTITRYWDDGSKTKKSSPRGEYRYTITTPMKLNASATFTLARFIMLSADMDYINYSSGMLSAHDYDFFDENAEARDMYKPTINLRVGAEIRLRPISFRAGVQHYGNAYIDDKNSTEKWVASAGIGYRNRDFFFDLAYSTSFGEEDYYMYNPDLIDAANLTIKENRVVITAGYKF